MDINEIKKNCKYAKGIEDGKVICSDGFQCDCQWQVKCGAYFDCDEYEKFVRCEEKIKDRKKVECSKEMESEWHKHYCTNDCNSCEY